MRWHRALLAILCGCAPATATHQAPSDAQVRLRFAVWRTSFEALRDLLLEEPAARSVGTDRIGDCALEAGQWRCRGVAVGETEALRRAQLSRERYRRYRALLAQVEAVRATRGDHDVEIILSGAGLSTSGEREWRQPVPRWRGRR